MANNSHVRINGWHPKVVNLEKEEKYIKECFTLDQGCNYYGEIAGEDDIDGHFFTNAFFMGLMRDQKIILRRLT